MSRTTGPFKASQTGGVWAPRCPRAQGNSSCGFLAQLRVLHHSRHPGSGPGGNPRLEDRLELDPQVFQGVGEGWWQQEAWAGEVESQPRGP